MEYIIQKKGVIILKAVILVVEDDSIEAMDISRALSSFGYKVQGPVSSGKEALKKVSEFQPDLILMDIFLKGEIDGIETAIKIRKNLDIPFIFLTAHSDELTVEKAKIAEPLGYLIKPFDDIELKHAIDIAIYRNKMETKLKESEKKFQLLFDRTPVPYQSLDKKGYFLDVNQAWLDTMGYSREEVLGKNFAEFLTPDFASHFKINFPKFKDAGEIHGVRFKMLRKDGSVIFVEYDGKIGYDEMGNFKQTHCIFHDITEKHEMEKALKSSEERLNLTLNAVNVGIWDWNVPSGNAVFSPEYYTMLGYEPYEFPQNYDSWRNLVHPEDIGLVEQEIQKRMNSDGNYSVEMRMKTKSGQWRWIFTEGKVVERDQDGDPVRMVGTHKDITERINMEKALYESEEKYRTLFNANPDYVFLIGPDGKIKDVNDATTIIVGLPKEKILGNAFLDFEIKLNCNVKPYMDKIARLLHGNQIDPFEMEITDLNGDKRWLNIFTSIIEKEGSILYILIMARDITLEKKISKEIKESLKEKEVLLQEIHHRVKNNMQIISSLMSLQTKYVDDEVSLDVLKESQNRVKSMALVHEKLYRSEDLTHINIYNYINNLVLDLFFSYGVSRDQITPIIDIDEIKLNIETAVPCGLIINELVSNVIKHAFRDKKGGKMWLSLHLTDDNQIELMVADNGSGLPNGFNINSSNSLGMQLVNSLVNQLDGSIKIKRSNGTKFTILFKELIYENRI